MMEPIVILVNGLYLMNLLQKGLASYIFDRVLSTLLLSL